MLAKGGPSHCAICQFGLQSPNAIDTTWEVIVPNGNRELSDDELLEQLRQAFAAKITCGIRRTGAATTPPPGLDRGRHPRFLLKWDHAQVNPCCRVTTRSRFPWPGLRRIEDELDEVTHDLVDAQSAALLKPAVRPEPRNRPGPLRV